MLKRLAICLVLAGTLLVAAATAALAAEVRITDRGFDPDPVSAAPGEAIIWTNETSDEVTLVATDGSWDSGPVGAGETFSLDLRRAGTYEYSTADDRFTGTIEVAEADAEPDDDEAAEASLPRTGAPVLATLALAGLMLFGGGLIVLRTSR